MVKKCFVDYCVFLVVFSVDDDLKLENVLFDDILVEVDKILFVFEGIFLLLCLLY